MPATDRNLTNIPISESFWRLMQTDPIDDVTLLDGTGSLVTYLAVSGTIDAYTLKGGTIEGTNANLDGNLLVGGTITAQTYVISSSVVDYQTIQVSGSTKFGDTVDDVHQFTGSLYVTGALVIPSVQTLPISADAGTVVISGSSLYIYY